MITFLIYKGNNNVTLIDNDIVNAVKINPDKNAVFLFSIFLILFAIFLSFTNEKFLSKANNHHTKKITHTIETYITFGILNFITSDIVPTKLCRLKLLFYTTEEVSSVHIVANIFNFNNANTNVADNKVTDNVTKNCITVIHKALLSDCPFNNISNPVISNTELTPHLVPKTIDIKLFADILSASHSPINAPAIGEPDMVISVIKYDKKKDLTGEPRNFTKKNGSKAFTKLYLIKSNHTNKIIIDINIKNNLEIILYILFLKIFCNKIFNSKLKFAIHYTIYYYTQL